MAYCTVAQARAQGCTGTDTEVTGYIAMAQQRVDEFTRQVWEPTPMAVVADIGADGVALLPRRVRTVTSVTPVPDGPDAPDLPPDTWHVTSSATLGGVDAVRLDVGGWDDLIAGAESWAGGWAGLLDEWAVRQVRVEGEFGHDAPPPAVQLATALAAAAVQQIVAPAGDGDGDGGPGGLDVDDEGNNVRIEPDGGPGDGLLTTGSGQADALLRPYIGGGLTVLGGV